MSIEQSDGKRQLKFKGLSINSGRISGKVCLYSAERFKAFPKYPLSSEAAVKQELERFDEVLVLCTHELNRIASEVSDAIGKTEAEIFLAQKHIMNDPKLIAAIEKEVAEDRKNVEWAISDVLGEYEEKFATLDNQYLRERSSDIGEIRRRLLSRISNKKSGFICEGQAKCAKGENRIIVAEELTPDMVINMNLEKVLGFVTEHGGITSHAAILSRSLGIPSVSGIAGLMNYAQCGDTMLVDGDSGEVFLNPDPELVAALVPVEPVQSEAVCVLGTPAGMEVLANTSTMEDVKHAMAVGADGIGLFRTEILFIKADRLLTEEEQYAYYREVVRMMRGKPVTFRLLDVGGDKPLPFLRVRKESNPYLGWRGARFLLGSPEVFKMQIRALGRLSTETSIKIIFPMVVDAAQQKVLLDLSREFLSGVECDMSRIEFGAMFEIPSSFLQASRIFELVDFGSVGSNDLIQYLFAIDRTNELVSQDYNPEHPVLWDMLEMLSETAQKVGKPLSICGEMAGRESIPAKLLDAGIRSLSVSPRLVPRVRNEMSRYAGVMA
ncbi:MAG: phosphoenolpyruvate--protein phosphotransferase [Fibrobacter sp.]|jgi:phosphotransferase system enzyme I (PtsI)|nr:phosphoenolpyruvate--protein phosphotransferase [Fibrobacter sp.]